MLAYIADKFKKGKAFEPVIVIDDDGAVFATVEIEEFFELRFLAGQVMVQCGLIQQVSFSAFTVKGKSRICQAMP